MNDIASTAIITAVTTGGSRLTIGYLLAIKIGCGREPAMGKHISKTGVKRIITAKKLQQLS
jgi:hypothetical protein